MTAITSPSSPVSVAGDREPVRVAHRGGGMAVLDEVVLGLDPRRVPGHPAALAEPAEAVEPPGDQLVHVALVAGVPHDRVAGRVEDPVERQGQLDRAQVGAEVPAVDRDRVDEHVADLLRERAQLVVVESAQRLGSVDCFEQGVHHEDRAVSG